MVNAAGLWAREVAALAGVELPLIPTEHQYFVTEGIPAIEALDRRLPSVADRDGEYYLRQEGNGLLVGAYEKDVRFWADLPGIGFAVAELRSGSTTYLPTICPPSWGVPA